MGTIAPNVLFGKYRARCAALRGVGEQARGSVAIVCYDADGAEKSCLPDETSLTVG